MSYGIAVFDINLKPTNDAAPGEAIDLIDLYGPYDTAAEAEDFRAFIEQDTRAKYENRYGKGRYEFKIEIRLLQTAPVMSEGWL